MRRLRRADRPWLVAGIAVGFVSCTLAVINAGRAAEHGDYLELAFQFLFWLIGAIVAVGSAHSLQAINVHEEHPK